MRFQVIFTYDSEYKSIPSHRELAPGLLRGLIQKAGLTVDEFLAKK